jgi:Spy/CpxP family protein refolding chaperone
MNCAKLLLACFLLFWVSLSTAQNAARGEKDHREVLRMGLYPPDILMRQQQALDISSEQRKDIAALVRDFQGKVTELQWAMPNEQQKLKKMLAASNIDSEAALAQAAQVLKMESEFKLAHFELLIAIKNELTDEQINILDKAIQRRLSAQD